MPTKTKEAPPVDEQVEQLQAALEQKQNQVDNLTEQAQMLGGFKAEALNSRETIAELQSRNDDLEMRLASQARDHGAALSAATAAAAASSASAKKVQAAEDLAAALKVLLG